MKPKEDALFSAHAIVAALRSSIRVLRWGMAALVLVYLGSGITMVGPNQEGLVLRFGRLLPEVHPPGLLFALPSPIDEVLLVDAKTVQERTLDAWALAGGENRGFSTALHPVNDPYTLTGDANIIRAKFSVRYQVANPGEYVFGARDRDATLDAILYQCACRVIAGKSVDAALTTERDAISRETLRLAQAESDRLGLGVQLLAVETREIAPPAQVAASFQDVVSAKVEAKTLVEPANSYRADALPSAEAAAYRIKSEADAYAQQLVAEAQGRAFSFLALLKEYQASPKVVRARIYNEMIQTTLSRAHLTTVMPSGKGEIKVMLAPVIAQDTENSSEETGTDTAMPLSSSQPRPLYPSSNDER